MINILKKIKHRIIKYRFENVIINKLEEIKWWQFSENWLENNYTLFQDVDKFIQTCTKSFKEIPKKIK